MSDTRGEWTRAAHGLWIGPLVALVGFLSYYTFFAQWPVFRDTAWLNIAILVAGVVVSAIGLRAVWDHGWLRRGAAVASVLVSGGLTALLIAYCYVLSYELPSADLAAAEGDRLPALTLSSDAGAPVDLATLDGTTIVVFYRGFW